jgi:hypothetical protein
VMAAANREFTIAPYADKIRAKINDDREKGSLLSF